MRYSAWSSLAISVCSALVLASEAAAHVTTVPSFVEGGNTASVAFTAPNERKEPMTGFRVAVPSDFRIRGAEAADAWRPFVQDTSVTWRGGSLSARDEVTFTLELEAPVEPGPARLGAEQLYPRGAVVRWPVDLTVVPAAENTGRSLAWAAITAVLGLGVLALLAVLLWRRRASSLQEK